MREIFRKEAMKTSNQPSYQLTIRPLPDSSDPGGIRRLRRALKALVRSYGLRCTSIQPAKEDTSTKGEADAVASKES